MSKRGLPAAWAVVGMLALGLLVFSALTGPPRVPSLEDIIRATVSTPHERLSMA